MEVNKDEALRCLGLSRNHRNSGNITSALKFARKSISLYKTNEAVQFLAELETLEETTTTSQKSAPSSSQPNGSAASASGAEFHPSASTTHHRAGHGASKEKAPEEKKRDYTPEQLKVVKTVMSCKAHAYYEILSLSKDCEEKAIKKAYRDLALALHPDKNGAPGADEAFKRVSKAYQVLTDSDLRATYDANPSRDPESRGGGYDPSEAFAGMRRGGGQHFQAQMSPEDLFNAFFNGGFDGGFGGPGVSFTFGPGGFQTFGGGQPFRQARRAQPQAQPPEARSMFFQLLPLLVIVFLSLLTNLPSFFNNSPAPPHFSFTQSPSLSQQRTSYRLKVPYYVNPQEFRTHPIWEGVEESKKGNVYPPDALPTKVKGFEHDVERSYISSLRHHCSMLMEDRERRIERASGFMGMFGADWEKINAIKKETYESCQKLQKFRNMGYIG